MRFATTTLVAALVSILSFGPVASARAASAPDPRCAIFGDGFSWVESIGSCVRIGGLVRADAGFGRGHGSGKVTGGVGSEAQLGIEVNKDTELGPFRAVVIPRAGLFNNELR